MVGSWAKQHVMPPLTPEVAQHGWRSRQVWVQCWYWWGSAVDGHVSEAQQGSGDRLHVNLLQTEVYYGIAGRVPEGLSGSLTRLDRAKLSTLGCEQFLALPGPKSHHHTRPG